MYMDRKCFFYRRQECRRRHGYIARNMRKHNRILGPEAGNRAGDRRAMEPLTDGGGEDSQLRRGVWVLHRTGPHAHSLLVCLDNMDVRISLDRNSRRCQAHLNATYPPGTPVRSKSTKRVFFYKTIGREKGDGAWEINSTAVGGDPVVFK